MKKYNYKDCQSLFGYSADVYIRSKGQCQLCGCGGEPLNFDLWRQMTVEHLIGKSQGGYLKEIRISVKRRFPTYSSEKQEVISKKIDALNTMTACSFCNSTTSRDKNDKSMEQLLFTLNGESEEILAYLEAELNAILDGKRKKVEWKLESIRPAFEANILSKF